MPPTLPAWFTCNAAALDAAIAELCAQIPDLDDLVLDATKHGRKLRSAVSLELPRWLGWPFSDSQRKGSIRDLARIELLHAASCILDDVIDGDRVRRGVPAFFVRNGLPQAILTALVMLTSAFDQTPTAMTSDELIRATQATIIGEAWDTFLSAASPLSTDEALTKYFAKTTPYFALAHQLVARYCGRSELECRAARDYGYYVGAFYQAANDYYDWFHIPPTARGHDDNPVLLTFSVPMALLARRISTYHSSLGKPTARRALSALADIMRSEGIDADARAIVAELKAKAIRALPSDHCPDDLQGFLDAVDSPMFWSYSYVAN